MTHTLAAIDTSPAAGPVLPVSPGAGPAFGAAGPSVRPLFPGHASG